MTTTRSKISLKEAGKKATTTRGQKKELIGQYDHFEKKCANLTARFQKMRAFGRRLFQMRTKTVERPMPQQTRSTERNR